MPILLDHTVHIVSDANRRSNNHVSIHLFFYTNYAHLQHSMET